MKKTACCLIILLTAFYASELFAETTLTFPKTVDLLAVNGKEVSRQRGSIQLPDGNNQLLMRLVVDVGRDMPDLKYSDLIILSFSATDSKLQLVVPKVKSALEMRSFNRNTDIKLLAADNTPLPFAKDKLIKEGFQLGRDYEQELTRYNSTNAPAALAIATGQNQHHIKKTVANAPPSSSAENNQLVVEKKNIQTEVTINNNQKAEADAPMAKKMLLYWYDKADKKTRQEFLQIIKENN